MDTVVPGRGGRGGLLVMIDRCSRRYVAERIGHVSQDCVVRAIGRMRARGAPPVVRTVTTDNGCEFPGQRHLDGALGAEVTTRGPTPRGKRGPSRTATASSAGGTRREPTSAARRGARSGTSRTGSTQCIGNHSTEKRRMITIHVLPRRIRDFLLTHYPCKLPSFFAIRTSAPPLCSLGRIWYNMRH